MLETQTKPTVTDDKPVQYGPPYQCFSCGAARKLAHGWSPNPANWCPLDDPDVAPHIWYMRKCACGDNGRVARLGDAITPLEFCWPSQHPDGWHAGVAANADAVRAAVEYLAQSV